MGLLDFTPETAEIKFRGKGKVEGSFTVRGLALDDFSELIRTHLPDIVLLIDKSRSGIGSTELLISAVRDAPIFCAHCIGLASGETGAFANALKLPALIQIGALQQIMQLTFEPLGDSGNAFAAMVEAIKSVPLPNLIADAAATTGQVK